MGSFQIRQKKGHFFVLLDTVNAVSPIQALRNFLGEKDLTRVSGPRRFFNVNVL